MKTRRFGRLGWSVGEIGYGMWGIGGQWGGADDDGAMRSLRRAAELGCNFFDTALIYGDGHSERLLGKLLRENSGRKVLVASKIPPKNGQIPARPDLTLDEVFPPSHIRECTERSLENLGADNVDLMQFHAWQDDWAHDERWQETIREIRDEGLVGAWGLCTNRWEPSNCIKTLETGLIDCLQVTYNIFDQVPDDAVLPLCQRLDVAVIARVPFDEGSLTGNLTKASRWPETDWRSKYFQRENLYASIERADALKPLVPPGMTLAGMALRFILANPAISVVIPGMRTVDHVEENIGVTLSPELPESLLRSLRTHRWDRSRLVIK